MRPKKGTEKVTPELKIKVREEVKNGLLQKEVAKKYDINVSVIQKIVSTRYYG